MGRAAVSAIRASGILTKQREGSSIPFDYSLNPYHGCAFGCGYCYVTRFLWGDDAVERAETWGRWVEVKENAVSLLQKEMRRLYGKTLVLSSATDPYQPIERKLELTRACLEVLLWAHPARLHVQTRSPLVTRDIDLLQRFGSTVKVGFSVATDDDEVRKAFEPAAPSIPQRFRAMRQLKDSGIYVTAAVAPLLPCNPPRLAALVRECACDYWVAGLRHHRQDPRLLKVYRDHGWMAALSPSHEERVRAELGACRQPDAA